MATKKILLVSEFSPEAFAWGIYKSLFQIGYSVTMFEQKKRTSLSFAPASKLAFLFSTINDYIVNKKLRAVIKKTNPDLIFLVKADNITTKTLLNIKRFSSIPIINWYPDNPFTFWNGVSNAHVLRSLPLYDAFITWSHIFVDPLRSAGCKQVLYAPFGYDESIYEQQPDITNEDRLRYGSDVSFVGSWEPDRQWWLEELCTRLPALDLAIWGTGWHEQLPTSSPLHTYLRGYTTDMRKIFQLSKISLNFIRTPNLHAHNMRTMEIPASKGFQLAQRTTEHAEQLFREPESITCFATPEELVAKIEYFLQNPELRKAIAHTACQHAQRYRLSTIVRNVLDQINFGE